MPQKCVIVGDHCSDKIYLLIVYSTGEYPVVFVPTVFEDYITNIEIHGHNVELALWDTTGQEDESFDRIRQLNYMDSDVLLLCFAIDNPDSLKNIVDKWMPDVRQFCPKAPIVLVGTKKELRDDPLVIFELSKLGQHPVDFKQGHAVAEKIGAFAYVECSTKLNDGVIDVFETAARAVLKVQKKKNHKKLHSCQII